MITARIFQLGRGGGGRKFFLSMLFAFCRLLYKKTFKETVCHEINLPLTDPKEKYSWPVTSWDFTLTPITIISSIFIFKPYQLKWAQKSSGNTIIGYCKNYAKKTMSFSDFALYSFVFCLQLFYITFFWAHFNEFGISINFRVFWVILTLLNATANKIASTWHCNVKTVWEGAKSV